MNDIFLPSTGRRTSQLGFGCSSLMGALGRTASLALLENAYSSGIRHFDVAPMYGYGAAEACLGEFLARHPGECTVTTKYGILPPSNQGLLRTARRIVGPILRLFPAARKRVASAANTVVDTAPKAPFTRDAARASLERSLRQLRLERLDIFLLHEVEAPDLQDETLLSSLQQWVTDGTLGSFGCGSSVDKIPALHSARPKYCPVLQFEWSVLDKPLDARPSFTIHHRTLTERFSDLHVHLRDQTELRKRWSAEVQADLARPGMLAALMLKAALVENPDSIILVSSRNPSHIAENARVACDESLTAPARRLCTLAQREGAKLLSRGEPT